MVYTKITNGIQVTVKVVYDPDLKGVDRDGYVFRYFIDIYNYSDTPVQLLSRQWHIFDLLKGCNEVNGPGVVGKQPIIESGADYSYHSAVLIQSKYGYMSGTYTMLDMVTKKKFEIDIPQFELAHIEFLN